MLKTKEPGELQSPFKSNSCEIVAERRFSVKQTGLRMDFYSHSLSELF